MRILHSGSKAQDKGDSRNHGFYDLYDSVVFFIEMMFKGNERQLAFLSRPTSCQCLAWFLEGLALAPASLLRFKDVFKPSQASWAVAASSS